MDFSFFCVILRKMPDETVSLRCFGCRCPGVRIERIFDMAEKIKVGVWGLGRAGYGMHLPELDRFPELFEIVAGCDISEERRRSSSISKLSL